MAKILDLNFKLFEKEIHETLKELEDQGIIRKTGEIRSNEPVYEITDYGLKVYEEELERRSRD